MVGAVGLASDRVPHRCSHRPPSCPGTGNWSAAGLLSGVDPVVVGRRSQTSCLRSAVQDLGGSLIVRMATENAQDPSPSPPGAGAAVYGPDMVAVPQSTCARCLACDFLTVDSVRLGVLYVLVLLEIGSRRVTFCNATSNPVSAWVAQPAARVSGLADHPGLAPPSPGPARVLRPLQPGAASSRLGPRPSRAPPIPDGSEIVPRQRLHGLINEYSRAA